MDWMGQWIDVILEDVPAGSCRRRMEAELRDHLETLRLALRESGRTEAEAREEALQLMGRPESLRREYRAAWRQTLPERLASLWYRLKAWAVGCAAMLGVHLLAAMNIAWIRDMALSLPGDSADPLVRLIRGTLGNLHNTWLGLLFPLATALTVGAYYLGRRFRTARRPAWQISLGLSFHWAFIAWFHIWWEAADDHRTFWAELWVYLTHGPSLGYYALTLALCVLLGAAFGRGMGRTATA